MESYLVAGAFFLMVFTPAIVGARNSARDSRGLGNAGNDRWRRFRVPSLSTTLSGWRSRRRWVAPPVAIEDPLQALALETPLAAETTPEAAFLAQPAAYVKNFAFDVSRFNQPQRRQNDSAAHFEAVAYASAGSALQTVPLGAAELATASEASAEDAAVSYGDPEPLYVRRAVYGSPEPRYIAHEAKPREEMLPYPYAPQFPYPAQVNPYAAAYPMAPPMAQGYAAPYPMAAPMAQGYAAPMAQGYAPAPPQIMPPQFPNPYMYPFAFAQFYGYPGFPMGFPPFMGYPMAGPQQYPAQPPMGPQLVEPYAAQPGYPANYQQNAGRWEHRSNVPYRSLYRRA